MMQIEKIIKKLPISTQEMFASSFATQESWSPEWEIWAKETLLQCNYAKDDQLITKLEWQMLRNKFFGKLGVIGEMPHCNNLEFMSFLYYDSIEKD